MAHVIIPPEHRSTQRETAKLAPIIGPDGSILNKPTIPIEPEEARLLKKYRAFLEKYGLREAIFCQQCFDGNRADGTRFHVTPNGVMIECRCRTLLYAGLL